MTFCELLVWDTLSVCMVGGESKDKEDIYIYYVQSKFSRCSPGASLDLEIIVAWYINKGSPGSSRATVSSIIRPSAFHG